MSGKIADIQPEFISETLAVVRYRKKWFQIIRIPRIMYVSYSSDGIPSTYFKDMMTGREYKERPVWLDNTFFWVALLAVPKYHDQHPTINKYSPTIAKSEDLTHLMLLLKDWLYTNWNEDLWELRER